MPCFLEIARDRLRVGQKDSVLVGGYVFVSWPASLKCMWFVVSFLTFEVTNMTMGYVGGSYFVESVLCRR